MPKLIQKKTRKNVEKLSRRLDSEMITIELRAMPKQTMTAGEALLMGGKLLAERKEAQAVRLAEQLEVKYSDIIDVHLLKIRALLQLERLKELIPLLKKMIKLAPDNIGVLLCAAQLEIILGNMDVAEKHLIKSNQVSPKNVDVLLQAAMLYRLSGEKKKARKMLLQCLKLAENKPPTNENTIRLLATVYSRLTRNGGIEEAQYNVLKSIAGLDVLDDHSKSQAYYALAEHHSQKKNIVKEISYLELANTYEAKWLDHKLTDEEYQKECDREFVLQREQFSEAYPEWLKGVEKNEDCAPIFILGMPRSGTTLIEQILGGHSLIGQTGESKALAIGVGLAYEKHQPAYTVNDFPRGLSKLPLDTLSTLADSYALYQEHLTNKQYYVDKEISNFKMVGLAANLFPRAKFIHINRAPLDIFLSCYKNSIPGIRSTSKLTHLALNYIYMKRLVWHWLKIFPERVTVIDYAELVTDTESRVRDVFQFLGLEFEPEALAFHERKNIVRTLSTDQVKKGIYKSSVDKWVPYENMLMPAKELLDNHGISTSGVRYLESES